MGWLGSGLMFPVSFLILVWVAGSGSIKVLHEPTCSFDYISTSICEWKMDGPTNCSAELRLSYKLDFLNSENHTCITENTESAVCMCDMLMADVVIADTYQLHLWAGKQLLWSGSFTPSEHVKPRAPENLTVHTNVSHMWQLTWSNPYSSENYLYSKLFYLVNISNEDDPTDFITFNVNYVEPTIRISARTLKPGVFYSARVRAMAHSYNGTWSEWSQSITWFNYYDWPWEQYLPLAVSISCILILVIFLSCYFSIIRIKKQWWDQIPNPAHSPVMAIVIQESQVSLWGKPSRGQEPAKCPHWKTCLTKLLPCFLEHGMEKDDSSSKAARNGPLQGPGKSAWLPVEVSKMVLWPECPSVVKCVELFEAQVESEEEEEEEEVEEDKGGFCSSPESSGCSFQEGREDIAARLTESLFLDLLEGGNGGFRPQGLGESCLLPPSESRSAPMPWAEFPRAGSQEASLQGREQPFHPGSSPAAALAQSPGRGAGAATPTVSADNPAYRRFSSLLGPPPAPGELHSDPQPVACLGEGDPHGPCGPQLSEPATVLQPKPETWEQVLRQHVLQHRAAAAPASAPSGGYRAFVLAGTQGGAPGSGAAGTSPSGEAGYKAFSSLLASSAVSSEPSAVGADSGEGVYRPFQSLSSDCPEAPAPVPLFTFGLDVELPHSPQNSLLPSSSPECLILEPAAKGGDSPKPPLSLEQATDPLRDDLGSGIVYSALTCHLCGHLKQCHGQEEHGKAHVVASPCCGCCCGDRSSPPLSPLRNSNPLPDGVPPEASLPSASLASLGVSEEGKPSLFFQPAHSNAQNSSQTPKVLAMLSTGPVCMSAS